GDCCLSGLLFGDALSFCAHKPGGMIVSVSPAISIILPVNLAIQDQNCAPPDWPSTSDDRPGSATAKRRFPTPRASGGYNRPGWRPGVRPAITGASLLFDVLGNFL